MSKLLLALCLIISSSVYAGQCDGLYKGGKQIMVRNTTELCNSFYAVAYDKTLKGPIVSFERFDSNAPSVVRKDAFRPDIRLQPSDRAELIDFKNSGYDRGHMTPAADSSSDREMYDTFLLSNMTPQSKRLNEVKWRLLEDHVRKAHPGVTYVANGAIYGPEKLGPDRIGIPVQYYKIAWYSDGTTESFLTESNLDQSLINPVSIDKINSLSGISFPK